MQFERGAPWRLIAATVSAEQHFYLRTFGAKCELKSLDNSGLTQWSVELTADQARTLARGLMLAAENMTP